MAVISLAFGQYILEPLFMPCGIPPLAVKLATAIGLSIYLCYCNKECYNMPRCYLSELL